MTMTTGSVSRRPSRLLERLRHTPGTSRVGFQTRAAVATRRLALIAHLTRVDAVLMAAAVRAGADALEVRVDGRQDLRALADLAARIEAPVGVVLGPVASASLAEDAVGTGIDWVRLPLEAPITVLDWEKPARLLTLPRDLDLRLAGALNTVQIDAAVLEGVPSSGLSLGETLGLRMLIERIKKPVVIHLGTEIAAAAIADHLGCDGVLVTLDDIRAAELLAPLVAALARPA